MKNILIFIIALYAYNLTAQNSKAVIIFKKEIFEDNNSKNREVQVATKRIMDEVSKDLEEINFELKIEDFKSEFSVERRLSLEDTPTVKYAISMGDSRGVFYSNLNTRTIVRSGEFFGQVFNIRSSLDSLKWNLKSEHKYIGKYKCFKAESIKVIKNSKGTFKHIVEAWYAPDIPLNFGPVSYGGLPGLILEVKYQNIRFIASKISLNFNDEIIFSKLKKGKDVTFEEYNDIVKKMIEKSRGEFFK